jgi:hypothetical protein
MKSFTIYIERVESYYVKVKAESEEEAQEQVKSMSWGELAEHGLLNDSTITNIETIKEKKV